MRLPGLFNDGHDTESTNTDGHSATIRRCTLTRAEVATLTVEGERIAKLWIEFHPAKRDPYVLERCGRWRQPGSPRPPLAKLARTG